MRFGVWMVWDEYKPCFPGTDEHDRSVGKWIRAGAWWLTDSKGEPVLFECITDAMEAAVLEREHRRNAHPPFTIIAPKPYKPTSPGHFLSVHDPNLRGLFA
jgi:hypothetical protein